MKNLVRFLVPLFLFMMMSFELGDQAQAVLTDLDAQTSESSWVETTYNSLSEDEKIGQLMMVRAHSDKGAAYEAKVMKLVKDERVGGLCFFQGTPERQVKLINDYQAAARVPLLVAMDAEWGLGMRFKKNGMSFPKELTLGAIQDNRLIYEMGVEIARQCRRVGVHVNFAPVADVNNNAANPVIGNRSFGEDRYNVAAKSYMYAKGLEDGGVLACAKHFPGHGDTDVDSHYDLPVIKHSRERLEEIELFPFQILADQGVGSMMVAHLAIPALDDTPNLPTTLSRPVVTDLLRKKMGFDGLIITDGLGMKGVTKHFKPGEVEAKALIAGNDILLLPEDVKAAKVAIKAALADGSLDRGQFEASVKRVLREKYTRGAYLREVINPSNLRKELETAEAKILKRRLFEKAITAVRDDNNVFPIIDVANTKIGTLSIGTSSRTVFQNTMGKYASISHYTTGKSISASKQKSLVSSLKRKDVVFVSLHDMSRHAKKGYGISESSKELIAALRKETNVVVVAFGSPYSLSYFDDVNGLICAYEEDPIAQEVTAQAIFGATKFEGKLPVTASEQSRYGMGETTAQYNRLRYDIPERVGLNSDTLRLIDGIAREAIREKATPGCQVLVVKNGTVVFNKAYGYHTYANKRPVTTSDIYDLASITKVAATTLAVMKLQEQGQVDIHQPMSQYLPMLRGSNKSSLTIRDMMAHHAGLKAWIPFYTETLDKKKKPSKKIYGCCKTDQHGICVTDNLYMKTDYVSTIWNTIKDSELRSNSNYKYSDLGLILTGKMVHDISKQPLDKYVENTFYKSLGLQTLSFKPTNRHDKSRIVPSEKDTYFRYETVHGHVHDMGCAMFGGVSGHAGLFSNSNDLAILMQMLLNDGYYGGTQYLRPSTITQFATRHERSTRRGIGFDMKELNDDKSANFSSLASPRTFGHLGFTGTAMWADPENDIIYIFLSNRTYPRMNNWKLNKLDTRPRIQDVIYRAMSS